MAQVTLNIGGNLSTEAALRAAVIMFNNRGAT